MKKINGYAKFKDGDLRPALLIRHKNGLDVVKWADGYFEAHPDTANVYNVSENTYHIVKFFSSE